MRASRRLSMPAHILSGIIRVDEEETRRVKQINQYLVIQKIGSGANSKVFLVKDINNGDFYAMKQVSLETKHRIFRYENAGSSVDREVRYLRSMNHPSIISLREVLYDKFSNRAILIIEWADCGSLQDLIKSQKTLAEPVIASIYSQITDALLYLHSKSIVHQDVKPSNILIFSNGRAKLSDLGVGRSFASSDSVTGSPAYQAPEIVFGESGVIDPAKEDVWSLGVSLYETCYKKLPFGGLNVYEIASKARSEQLDFLSSVSPPISTLLALMLNPNPAERISLQDVRNFPFIRDAPPIFEAPFVPKVPEMPDLSLEVVKIKADVCDETFSFKNAPEMIKSRMRSFTTINYGYPARCKSRS